MTEFLTRGTDDGVLDPGVLMAEFLTPPPIARSLTRREPRQPLLQRYPFPASVYVQFFNSKGKQRQHTENVTSVKSRIARHSD